MRLERILEQAWPPGKAVEAEPLRGGITKRNFRVSLDGEPNVSASRAAAASSSATGTPSGRVGALRLRGAGASGERLRLGCGPSSFGGGVGGCSILYRLVGDFAPARREPDLGREHPVELHRVHRHPRRAERDAQLTDKPRGMEGRTTRELGALAETTSLEPRLNVKTRSPTAKAG